MCEAGLREGKQAERKLSRVKNMKNEVTDEQTKG